MRLKATAIGWYIFALCILALPTISQAALQSDDSGIPALLQFATQYNEEEHFPVKSLPQPDNAVPVAPLAKEKKVTPRNRNIPSPRNDYRYIKDKEIQRQRSIIAQLEAQLANLPPPQSTAVVDFIPLSKLVQNLRQVFAITPTEKQVNMLIIRGNMDRLELQQQLSEALKSNQALLVKIDNQKALVATEENKNKALFQQQQELHSQGQLMKTELDNTAQEMATLRSQISMLETRVPQPIGSDILKQPRSREDYAAGISLGEEILQIQEERRQWGATADKKLILAGITDSFAGKRELTDSELNEVLGSAEKRIAAAREKTISAQKQKGDAYLNEFKKDKNVRQAPYGFWYRIDYAGDAMIPDTASVDIVVKEVLTDGTVIQDMAASGATLSQPVEKFPPLFKEAIKLLKNHGTITLVVPPELAYGDKGYSPNIPPNATMIYTLYITEMYP